MIKGRYVAMVKMTFEVDENEPWLKSAEEMREALAGVSKAIEDWLTKETDITEAGGSIKVTPIHIEVVEEH